jgi:hypothetical protein
MGLTLSTPQFRREGKGYSNTRHPSDMERPSRLLIHSIAYFSASPSDLNRALVFVYNFKEMVETRTLRRVIMLRCTKFSRQPNRL